MIRKQGEMPKLVSLKFDTLKRAGIGFGHSFTLLVQTFEEGGEIYVDWVKCLETEEDLRIAPYLAQRDLPGWLQHIFGQEVQLDFRDGIQQIH
jgi:hypothetical protein